MSPWLAVGEGIETVLSLVTAVPEITAAALSAGSLGAFSPPPGAAHLVIARENDGEGERAARRLARLRAGGRRRHRHRARGQRLQRRPRCTRAARALAARLAPAVRSPDRGREEE